jgi:hypothetical protein
MFSFSNSEYQKILKFWFETELNHTVCQISRRNLSVGYYIDGMIRSNNKKWSTYSRFGYGHGVVRRYLNLKQNNSYENIKLEQFLSKNDLQSI